MKYTNETLSYYAKPLSKSEKDNCESTIRVVKNILENFGFRTTRSKNNSNEDELDYSYIMIKDNREFTVLLQGSYGNGTGVRQESDVDVSIISESVWHGNYNHFKREHYGFVDSDFSIIDFKYDLASFINLNYPNKIRIGNKCIDFEGNGTSRKNVDLVPCYRYRDYSNDLQGTPNNYVGGIYIECKDGNVIINYPEQTRINSTKKNNDTNYYYKKVVRILKNIKNDMKDNGIMSANAVSSFALESIIYNVPNPIIDGCYNSMYERINAVITYLYNYKNSIEFFKEPNEILYIFNNPNNVYEEICDFINDLWRFFE